MGGFLFCVRNIQEHVFLYLDQPCLYTSQCGHHYFYFVINDLGRNLSILVTTGKQYFILILRKVQVPESYQHCLFLISGAKANSVFIFWSENCKGCLTARLPAISRVLRFGNIYGWSFFHLDSLRLYPSLNEGSCYFIHRLTPLVITSIILSTHSFTTRSITLHFLSEMAYFLVFWYRNVMVFYMPSEFWHWVWMAIRASLMQIMALTMPYDFA